LRTLLVVLLVTAGLATGCSSDDTGPDCGDARAVAKNHKTAAEQALLNVPADPVDPNDPSSAPAPESDDPAEALLKGFAKLGSSPIATTETQLYFATVQGNPTCFGAEERAQVDVLSSRPRQ
jgi:hypothetical protein